MTLHTSTTAPVPRNAAIPVVLPEKIQKSIPESKILVVGAGGIGCEILKNLALTGFRDIEIIDLDTIDVSNLNRQFLFRKEHVGKPKAVVARESVLSFNPDIQIKAYHDSIFNPDYGVNFFRRFKFVLNALDNRAARNHVNRMCLAADVPLLESGTAGYSGQVELIKKGVTQCYECLPKPTQRSFPGCTIRNTPSEPVHCIVWSKHLFNQLFGEDDPDQDVSPDAEDPELRKGENGGQDGGDKFTETDSGNVKRVSTRQWAQDVGYEPGKLFDKFFKEDILYLLTMETLWKTRKAPTPMSWDEANKMVGDEQNGDDNHRVWSIARCCQVFGDSVATFKRQLGEQQAKQQGDAEAKAYLVWDKDDKAAMDFVTACTNIRAAIFSIGQKSGFEVKSIAGNIIPAIATANALIAGLVVLYAYRLLAEDYEKCPTLYLRQKSVHSRVVVASDNEIQRANPKCYVCSSKPEVNLFVNVKKMTVREFEQEVLKNTLNVVAPDVVLDGKGVIVISSEEGETEANNDKVLSSLGIVDGCILKVDDFVQEYELSITINHYEAVEKDDPPFKMVANMDDLKPKESGDAKNGEPSTSSTTGNTGDEDDLMIVDFEQEQDPQEGSSACKKRKLNPPEEEEDDDLVMLDDLLD